MERLQILESKVEEADYAYKEAAKNYKDKMSSVRDSKHVSLIAYNDIRDALIWEKQAHSDLTIAFSSNTNMNLPASDWFNVHDR